METSNLNLNPGQMMLVKAKGIKGGKVELTFAQMIVNGQSNNSLANLINASDDRFGQQKPRYAWQSGEAADIQAVFGIDVSSLKEGEEMIIEQLDPMATGKDGQKYPLNIQIAETTKPTDWQRENIEKAAKRAGKDGEYIYHNGQHIFQNALVVTGEPRHFFYPVAETSRGGQVSTAASVAAALSND